MSHVSVVIPAYNGVSRYLAKAIESVLAQTFQGFDLTVVDDASQDGTEVLVLGYPKVRYHRRSTNGGQAAARNTGARLSGGAYLAFLDQDDLWEPTFLAETLNAASANPLAAVVHADGYQMREDTSTMYYDQAMKHSNSITLILRGGHDVATSGSLFRRTCFEAVGGYDETLTVWEDIDLGIRLYQRFPLLHLSKPLYRHRIYGHNASRDIPSARALKARQLFLNKHSVLCLPGTPAHHALINDWADYYSDLGKHLFSQHRSREARLALLTSLRHRPFHRRTFFRLLRTFFSAYSSPLRQTTNSP